MFFIKRIQSRCRRENTIKIKNYSMELKNDDIYSFYYIKSEFEM